MELKRIIPAQSQAAWYRFAKKLNQQQPVLERKRTVVVDKKTGEKAEKSYFQKLSKIPGQVMDTGRHLISLYIENYFQILSSPVLTAAYADGQLPSVFINNVRVGEDRGRTEKTIYNHIKRLKEVGLISGYKFHGTKHDFEIWIDPKFLWPEPFEAGAQRKFQKSKNAESGPGEAPLSTNFPLTTVLELPETKEIVIGNVDKGVAAQQNALPAGEGNSGGTFSGDIGPHSWLERAQKAAAEPLADSSPEPLRTPGGARPKPRLQEKFVQLVENFWFYARKMIYSDYSFTDREEKMAKNAIYAGVFRGFSASWSDQDWEKFYEDKIECLDLAAAYYRKHPDKHPPLPFAEFVPGAGYFDWENTRGFRKTHDWLISRLAWREQQRQEEALRKARRELKAHAAGAAPKRQQEKGLLQVFREHEARIRSYGPNALERFYAQNKIFHRNLNKHNA